MINGAISNASQDVTGIECAISHYLNASTVTVESCATHQGIYTPVGCAEILCSRPDTIGYNFSHVNEISMLYTQFEIEDLYCNTTTHFQTVQAKNVK